MGSTLPIKLTAGDVRFPLADLADISICEGIYAEELHFSRSHNFKSEILNGQIYRKSNCADRSDCREGKPKLRRSGSIQSRGNKRMQLNWRWGYLYSSSRLLSRENERTNRQKMIFLEKCSSFVSIWFTDWMWRQMPNFVGSWWRGSGGSWTSGSCVKPHTKKRERSKRRKSSRINCRGMSLLIYQ